MSTPHPFGPMRLIVNPSSGSGKVRSDVPRLTRALGERGLDFDVVETEGPGHASVVAREALDAGLRYLVAVGGDGTVHEVVNGMFDAAKPRAPDAVLGVAATGSGSDFARTFGLDRSPEVIARHLASQNTMDIDVGVVEYVDSGGEPAQRMFANIAEVGYGAEVVRRAERLPRWVGRLRYLIAAYGAIRSMERPDATVSVAHTDVTWPLVNLVVANCQFFGGGMWVAPRAIPQDGKFNVQIFKGARSQVFTLTTKIYRGEHLPHPDIIEYQSPTVRLAPDRRLLIEADGEVLGYTPASFWLVPKSLRLKN